MADSIDWILIIIPLTALIIMIGAAFIITSNVDQTMDRLEHHSIDLTDKINIVSLKDGSAVNGYFALGSGYINGRDVYTYYTRDPDGAYIRNSVDADISKIYTDENENPYIICHYVETNRYKVQFIHSYSFHVPNGTVMKSFSV